MQYGCALAEGHRWSSQATLDVLVILRLRPCRRPLDCWLAGLGVWFLVIVISLLKCVLARWFLDVSFHFTFYK